MKAESALIARSISAGTSPRPTPAPMATPSDLVPQTFRCPTCSKALVEPPREVRRIRCASCGTLLRRAAPSIEVRGVTKRFALGKSQVEVLRGVNLTVQKGEFVSLMGQSGSGKSTLLHLIGLLDTPSRGTVHLDGVDTSKLNERQRARVRQRTIGFVFQSFNLLPRLDARHNVALPLALAGVPGSQRMERADSLLDEVGLGDRVRHIPGEMSGGEKQRVAIARALALDPPILVADEPTGNLDSASSRSVMELFQSLHRAGRTIFQVTHDEGNAAYGSRLVRIKDGVIEPGAFLP